jgi:hypothetical protein
MNALRNLAITAILAVPLAQAWAQEDAHSPPANDAAPPPVRVAAEPAERDRLDLDTTIVTGNRELPKVLYIVPWKKPGAGELPGQPLNTLLDEVLAPLDRDTFRREIHYWQAVSGPDQPRDPESP